MEAIKKHHLKSSKEKLAGQKRTSWQQVTYPPLHTGLALTVKLLACIQSDLLK